MNLKQKACILTTEHIRRYTLYLQEGERSAATIQKYTHDLNTLLSYLDGAPVTKAELIQWKDLLTNKYAPATVNSMLTAVNGFLNFMG